MIEVYSWGTPNGHKVHIMLEECGLPYRTHAIDIGAGDQFKVEFLAISPNNKIPAIVDADGPDGAPISLFESGASWFDEIAARPAVQRGVEVLASQRKPLDDARARETLFGSTQYLPR